MEYSGEARKGNSAGIVDIVNANQGIYQFLHSNIPAGDLYYRIKETDIDGAYVYSNIVLLHSKKVSDNFVIFPNPASNILYVQASGENEKASFQIFDIDGRKLREGNITLNGNTLFSISINELSKGIYNLELHTKAKIETRRFIKK